MHSSFEKNFLKFPYPYFLADSINGLCDAYHPGVVDESLSSNKPIPFFYFDHNGSNFEMILDLYRHGTLHVREVHDQCPMITKRDLDYWGIDEFLFEPCCSLRFHQVSQKKYFENKKI